MKIAQIAPLMESVPPRLYGGTERVVSHLCEALVQEGHDVTLFASGDSVTSARLVACTKEAIRLNAAIQDYVPHYMIMLDKLRRSSHLFDILHFHIDAFHMPLFRDIGDKTLTTRSRLAAKGKISVSDNPAAGTIAVTLGLPSVSVPVLSTTRVLTFSMRSSVAIGKGAGAGVLIKSAEAGIARAIVLSRATMRNIRENLIFAFAYNAIGIPIAAGVLYPTFGILLSPIIGALAMSLSSVSVIANALRLRALKPNSAVKPRFEAL
jgi:Glycosyltransferase Family 4